MTTTRNTSRAISRRCRRWNGGSTWRWPGLWKPSTAREIADLARLDTNKCSALLKRLEGRGVVGVEGGTPRRRQYYLTERLYNIYYLLRRGGGSNQVVKALIDFMVCLYSPAAMWDFAKQISEQVLDARIFPPHTASYVANTMLDEAQRLAELGQVDEALGIYDEGIRRLNAAGESGAESWVAKAPRGQDVSTEHKQSTTRSHRYLR